MKFARLIVLGFVGSVLVYGGCGGGNKPPALGDNPGSGHRDSGTTTTTHHPTPQPEASTGNHTPDANMSTGRDAATDGGDGGHEYIAANCGLALCEGTKRCVEDVKGAYCDCDPGFVSASIDGGTQFECILDTGCIKLRPVTHGCRANNAQDPVVASFFEVEYCGGVPVPPDELGDPAKAFKLLEDNKPIDLTESAATIIPRSVDQFVTLAVDVSGSVLSNPDLLLPLVGQLKGFVSKLARPPGEQPVTVSVLVFGRGVAEYVPPTTNLQQVDTALQDFIDNPIRVTSLVQINGTALYSAVKRGINTAERLVELRHEISQAGAMSSGVFVVVTDG
ncbi:MAG TPA: VWA domain-containing protein, partial [Polyangiaceae bacterium]|nr:VWA domain-containing protein [Polyangiaceae bacterium]